MLKRCYYDKYKEKFSTYENCYVVDNWLNFQNFAKWHNDNFYRVDEERMELDKDILQKGNKIYSPETCIYVPYKINYLFVKRDAMRGDLPIGVYYDKECHRYIAQCHDVFLGKGIALGSYGDELSAFIAYKKYKEHLINQVAEHYKSRIPVNLYNALVSYKVDITD